ncbi:MAG TPA: OmpA family protein [Aquaticitalea sp.]|nr:OmpA family protein [Aquaticitalea sp.]HNU59217.1 OmpA family protein [Aquaticitalea sp.]
MSKKTSYLLGILLTIVLGTLLYCYLCDSCYCCQGNTTAIEANVPDVKPATVNPFVVKDMIGDLSLNIHDNFNFNESGFNYLEPLAANVDGAIDQLKAYLADNPLKSLSITGHYTSGEVNSSAFPNLGLGRANTVKNYLVSKGIPSSVIDTYGKLDDSLVSDPNSVYFGPVSYDILTAQENSNNDDLKALGDAIRANPLVLYFDTGEASINLTAEQRQKVADISRYLDKVDGAHCLIVGHTDNTGDAANNMALGQDRADFAKNYFIRNGISGDKINASSKGQSEPIADNATEDGRSKNRRTVVTIN